MADPGQAEKLGAKRATNRINVRRVIGGSHFEASRRCLALSSVNGEVVSVSQGLKQWQGQRR